MAADGSASVSPGIDSSWGQVGSGPNHFRLSPGFICHTGVTLICVLYCLTEPGDSWAMHTAAWSHVPATLLCGTTLSPLLSLKHFFFTVIYVTLQSCACLVCHEPRQG